MTMMQFIKATMVLFIHFTVRLLYRDVLRAAHQTTLSLR